MNSVTVLFTLDALYYLLGCRISYPLQEGLRHAGWDVGHRGRTLFCLFMLDSCYDPRHVGEGWILSLKTHRKI